MKERGGRKKEREVKRKEREKNIDKEGRKERG